MDNDFYSCCIDEIALEGLDGITLQALWIRLQRRPNFGLSLDERSKEFIWQGLIPEPRLSFYKLETPRMDLVIYDRYQHVDPITGYVVEPAVLPPDTYPVQIINKNGQLGSCTTFDTRKDISDEIRRQAPKLAEAVATWGNSLVIVADQTTRELALLGPCNSTKDMDISETKYCILERIGRSRFMGQTTQGTLDLRVFKVSHANMFVIRKQLLQRNLITKQEYYEKGENKTSKTGFLLHLPRFFVEVKTKSKVLTKELCALLATKPQQREAYAKICTELGLRPIVFKKLMYSPSTSQYVTQYTLPYNEFYPDSSPDTWYLKNKEMRAVRVVELVKPYSDEYGEEDFEGFFADNDTGLYFHPHKYVYDRPRLDQAYKEVYKAGTDGMTLRELAVALMTTRLEVRNLQKGLITKKLVVPYRVDMGKQRVIRYYCPEFAANSEVHQKLAAEKKRMLESKNKLPPAKKRKTVAPQEPEAVGETKDAASPSETEPAASASEARPVEAAKSTESEKVVTGKRAATTTAGGARKKLKTKADAVDASSSSTSASTGVASAVPDGTVADQPIITVETNSDCHFRKVNPTTQIVFPNALGMTGREPLQRLLPSYNMLRRANRIIEFVQSEKLLSDLSKLIKVLQKAEEEDGSTMKLDRVSIERLIYKLCKGGYLKSIHTVLKLGHKVVDLKWICHPSVSKDDEIVRATIEQAKFRYFATHKDSPKPEPTLKPEPVPKPNLEMCKMEYSPSIGRFYGSQPKFRRMHLCYVFMHYLLYTYDGVPQEPLPDDPAAPVQYHAGVGWKMFVPPLTKSPTTPKGWVLFGDVLLSLPLSLFVKVVSCIRHKIEGLEEYLNDEVKRHYLIRFLPVRMRNALLFARRYIYSIHDTMKRLTFFGMLTFGPQRLKEKDQVFLFLHRKLRIKDTTPSAPGYHQVSADIQYPTKYFFLETEDDVNQFWLELENICVCSPLGMPQTMQGQSIELQNLYKKPCMVEACRNREFGEEQDDGSVPGDQLGAGGFDSALFAHLKRNWSYQTTFSSKPTTITSEKPVSKDPKPIQKFLNYLDKASKETGGGLPQKQRQRQRLSKLQGSISLLSASGTKERDEEPGAATNGKGKAASQQANKKRTIKCGKPQTVIRVIKPRKRRHVRRPYYDDKDQAALKEMKTMRVAWSMQEDIVLLMCKVTSWFLDPHLSKMVVPFTVVRDILSERYPERSRDKTSRACQRRLHFMLTNPATKANASVFLCEAQQDQTLVEMFHGPKPAKSDEEQWKSMFRTVLDHLMIKFSKSSEERHLDITLPKTLDELKSRYDIVVSGQVEPDSWSYSEPHNLVDIHFSSVAMVILASLAADDGKTSWSLILYKIYEQYPDKLVRSVTARLRHNGVISRKLAHSKKLFVSLNLSMLPFTLSKRFKFEMTRRYSPLHMGTMAKFLLELLAKFRSGEPYVAQDSIEPAYAPLLISLQLMDKITLAIEVPDGIVDFDSSIATTGLLPQRRTLPASTIDKLYPAAATLSDRARSLNFETAGGNAKTSRSFLYMLRQHMTKVLEYNSLRPQDYVVIKSCKLEFALTDEDLVPGWSPEEPTDKSYSLKIRHPVYDAIVQEQRVCHTASVIDTTWTPEEVLRVYEEEGRTVEDAQIGTEIYYFILKKEHLGVPRADLCEAFFQIVDDSALEVHLDLLLKKHLILQVGVKCIRYVTARHCKPWVIRSFKIPKEMRCFASLGDQGLTTGSKNVTVPEPSTSSGEPSKTKTPAETSEGDGSTAEESPDLTRPSTSAACTNTNTDSHVDADDGGVRIGERAPSSRRLRESGKRTLYETMTKNINLDNLKQLMYVPRLWRKPDGGLNRPVFHQMLSAVMSYILDNPGVTEDRFRTDFSHQIEPCVQTLDLLKMLEQLGCVKRFFTRVDTTAKCTLYSRRRELTICDQYCPGDTVCYEGTPEALVNFAAFTAYFTK